MVRQVIGRGAMSGTGNRQTLRFTMELLRRVPRSRKVTAAELQRQLDAINIVRTQRAIRMQLDTLAAMGEVVGDGGHPIGYRRAAKARGFDAAQMTEQESLLLMLAQKLLASLLPPSLVQALDGFFDQAGRELDPYGDDTLAKQWLSKVVVSSDLPMLIPPAIGDGVLETVSHALYQNLPLTIDYRHADGSLSHGKGKPLGLVQQGVRMYLVCDVQGKPVPYPFALHRIQKVKAAKTAFERPADFDLKRYDDEGGISFATGRIVKLTFRIRRKAGLHVTESPLADDQVFVDEGDSLLFTATYPESLRLARWLDSFGDDLEVVDTVVVEGASGVCHERP
jgi:predicted DNA-binding transcriptional regulator YafY